MYRGLTALLVIIFLALMTIANTGNGTYLLQIMNAVPFGDKLLHIVLIGSLTAGLNLSLNFRFSKILKWEILTGTIVMAVLISLEEVSQGFIPYRNFEVMDLVSNYIGIFVLGSIPYIIHKKVSPFAKIKKR